MSELFTQISAWVESHETEVIWVTAGSALGFLLSLLLIPWLLVELPADYFSNSDRDNSNLLGSHPFAKGLLNTIRNIIGFGLILLGILLLVLPGQGVLTILLGVAIAKFPGKRKLIRKLIEKEKIQHSLNWLRRKANKKEFEFKRATADRES